MSQGSAKPFEIFPHDRVVFFSDAVFAIVMTLLAIELRLPHLIVEISGIPAAFEALLLPIIGYVMSFAVTALFWVAHMQTWRHVVHTNAALVWLNTLQLLFVVLIPFFTGSYFEHPDSVFAFALYFGNLTFVSICSMLLRRYVVQRESLVDKLGAAEVCLMMTRSWVSIGVFLTAIVTGICLGPAIGGTCAGLIGIFNGLARRRYNHAKSKVVQTEEVTE